jgi:hypothetical protein
MDIPALLRLPATTFAVMRELTDQGSTPLSLHRLLVIYVLCPQTDSYVFCTTAVYIQLRSE